MQLKLDIALEEVRQGPIHLLQRYWEAKRRGRILPSWSDFDPADVKPVLPLLFVAGIEAAPFRVFYRLVGTTASDLRGPLTGRYLDEVDFLAPEIRRQLTEEYRLACGLRRPTYSRDALCLRSGHDVTFYGSIFPLSSDGTNVDRCVCVEDYGDIMAARGFGAEIKGAYQDLGAHIRAALGGLHQT